MLSILIVSPSLTLAGMEGQLINLLKHVNPDEYEIELALFRDLPGPLRTQIPSFIKITDLRKGGKWDLLFYARLFSLIRSTPKKVIDSKISGVNEILMLFCGCLKRDGLLLEIQSTQTYLAPYYRLMKMAFRLFKRQWTVLCNSQKAVQELQGYLPPGVPIVFVGSGLDVEKFRRKNLGHKETFFHIGFVGRVIPLKNLDVLIQALGQIKRDGDPFDFRLSIVGRRTDAAYAKKLSDQVKESGLERQVVFHDFVDELEDMYNQFDVLVLPSLFEGTPTVLLEAMACERTCLVSEGANTDHFVGDDFQFGTHQAADLADKLIKIKNLGPDRRADIGRQNREQVARHYTLDRMVDNYREVWHMTARQNP